MMENALQKLNLIIQNSAFNLSPNYSVNVNLPRLFQKDNGIVAYNDMVQASFDKSPLTPTEVIAQMTPELQRENTKWNRAMQVSFLENLLSGCEIKLQLYSVKDGGSEMGNCMILDGLQRSTALAAFQGDEFPVFNELYWSDLIRCEGRFPRLRLMLHIYQFESHYDACKYYVAINKGMTHNEKDLQTAYAFLEQHKPV